MSFLSDFLAGMSPASKASVSTMRRLIEQSRPKIPQIPQDFSLTPPVFLSAAFSLSDIRLFDDRHAPLNGYGLLFVAEGRGLLEIDSKNGSFSYSLKNRSLFFFPLSDGWRLRMENEDWKLYFFFLDGSCVPYYHTLFADCAKEAFAVAGSSMLPVHLTHLYDSFCEYAQDPLWICERLTNLLCLTIKEARSYAQSSLPESVPSYLISIRNSFHKDFAQPFSLAMLETHYHISRFRIAHEFSAAFGQSPIAYLNQLRLQKACELLIYSNDRIGEIGMAVGFENVNHFINLFRKQYGMTPGAYRKRYQATANTLEV